MHHRPDHNHKYRQWLWDIWALSSHLLRLLLGVIMIQTAFSQTTDAVHSDNNPRSAHMYRHTILRHPGNGYLIFISGHSMDNFGTFSLHFFHRLLGLDILCTTSLSPKGVSIVTYLRLSPGCLHGNHLCFTVANLLTCTCKTVTLLKVFESRFNLIFLINKKRVSL